ncbi:hypothetical protein MD537_04630 [Flavihumibacter sediminis]|nr:hypothetical protein [Flavihumibacter sediminis]
MRLFLKYLGVFVLGTILISIILQLMICFRIEGKTLTGHDNLDLTKNINADLLFLGSSRTWAHFDPHFFDSTFHLKSINIGVDGHSELSMAVTRLNHYLQHNTPPKAIILNVDPFISSGSITNNTNSVHKDNFARYAFIPKNEHTLIVDYFQFNTAEKYLPLYSVFKYNVLWDIVKLKPGSTPYEKFGFEMHNEQWDTINWPPSKENMKFYFKPANIPALKTELSEINQFCKSKGIKLLCIQTPVYRVIYDSSTFNQTAQMCKEIGIPFIDTNQESIINNIQFFYNSNHLNRRGIDEMNKILANNQMLHNFLTP